MTEVKHSHFDTTFSEPKYTLEDYLNAQKINSIEYSPCLNQNVIVIDAVTSMELFYNVLKKLLFRLETMEQKYTVVIREPKHILAENDLLRHGLPMKFRTSKSLNVDIYTIASSYYLDNFNTPIIMLPKSKTLVDVFRSYTVELCNYFSDNTDESSRVKSYTNILSMENYLSLLANPLFDVKVPYSANMTLDDLMPQLNVIYLTDIEKRYSSLENKIQSIQDEGENPEVAFQSSNFTFVNPIRNLNHVTYSEIYKKTKMNLISISANMYLDSSVESKKHFDRYKSIVYLQNYTKESDNVTARKFKSALKYNKPLITKCRELTKLPNTANIREYIVATTLFSSTIVNALNVLFTPNQSINWEYIITSTTKPTKKFLRLSVSEMLFETVYGTAFKENSVDIISYEKFIAEISKEYRNNSTLRQQVANRFEYFYSQNISHEKVPSIVASECYGTDTQFTPNFLRTLLKSYIRGYSLEILYQVNTMEFNEKYMPYKEEYIALIQQLMSINQTHYATFDIIAEGVSSPTQFSVDYLESNEISISDKDVPLLLLFVLMELLPIMKQ